MTLAANTWSLIYAADLLGSVFAIDPGVQPNDDGLPGLSVLKQMVGALLTWGLLACVAGLVQMTTGCPA